MRTILSLLVLFGLLSASTTPLLAQAGGGTVFLPLVTTGGQPLPVATATPVEEINPNDIQQDDNKPAVIDIETGGLPVGADAQRGSAQNRTMPTTLSGLQLTTPVMLAATQAAQAKLLGNLATATGSQQVIVRLNEMPLATTEVAASAVEARQAQLARLQGQQVSIIQQAQSLDSQAKLLGNTQTLLNAVMLEIDSQAIRTLAADPAILSIAAIADYNLDLDETVPYIGTAVVQASGFTIAPFGEQYLGIFQQTNQTATTLFEHTNDTLQILDFGPLCNISEQGILLFFSNGAIAGYEAGTIRVSE